MSEQEVTTAPTAPIASASGYLIAMTDGAAPEPQRIPISDVRALVEAADAALQEGDVGEAAGLSLEELAAMIAEEIDSVAASMPSLQAEAAQSLAEYASQLVAIQSDFATRLQLRGVAVPAGTRLAEYPALLDLLGSDASAVIRPVHDAGAPVHDAGAEVFVVDPITLPSEPGRVYALEIVDGGVPVEEAGAIVAVLATA